METKFGLPQVVEFCSRCVLSNQRVAPSVVVRDARNEAKQTVRFLDGVCAACRYVSQKNDVDWEQRQRELHALLDRYRSRNGSYDCLVPGSGGKDSVFQAHVLKTRYGMTPLTVTWSPHMYTDVGWRNFQNWIHKGGFDNYLFAPDGIFHRRLTRLAFTNLLHPFQPFVVGQRHFPAKIAKQMGIKLIFYGEHHAEYGIADDEQGSSVLPKYLTAPDHSNIRISGLSFEELEKEGIQKGKLDTYLPLTLDEFMKSGIEAHFLGYFLKWVPQEMYYYAVEHVEFEPNTERTEGTFSKYNSIDDKLDGFHYWCGWIKFGIGRCSHEASQEIRHGHITREEGVRLVHRFDGEFPQRFFPDVLEYLNMDCEEFHDVVDRFRSPHLWQKLHNKWQLRHVVS